MSTCSRCIAYCRSVTPACCRALPAAMHGHVSISCSRVRRMAFGSIRMASRVICTVRWCRARFSKHSIAHGRPRRAGRASLRSTECRSTAAGPCISATSSQRSLNRACGCLRCRVLCRQRSHCVVPRPSCGTTTRGPSSLLRNQASASVASPSCSMRCGWLQARQSSAALYRLQAWLKIRRNSSLMVSGAFSTTWSRAISSRSTFRAAGRQRRPCNRRVGTVCRAASGQSCAVRRSLRMERLGRHQLLARTTCQCARPRGRDPSHRRHPPAYRRRRRRGTHPRTGRPSEGTRRAHHADRPGAQRSRPHLRAGQRGGRRADDGRELRPCAPHRLQRARRVATRSDPGPGDRRGVPGRHHHRLPEGALHADHRRAGTDRTRSPTPARSATSTATATWT
jgi:hypothetical protein